MTKNLEYILQSGKQIRGSQQTCPSCESPQKMGRGGTDIHKGASLKP